MTALRWHGRLVLRVEGCSLGNDPRRGAALVAFMDTLPSEIGEVEVVLRGVSRGTAARRHSATEQAFAALSAMVDASSDFGMPYGHPARAKAREAFEAVERAQPLSSIAAPQPEQAILRELDDALGLIASDLRILTGLRQQPCLRTVQIAPDKIRAALAIPASPAASEQQASVSELPGLEYRTCCDHPDCTTCAGHGGFYRIAALSGRATIPSEADECAANGNGHSFGPHGRHGEDQCEWCGVSRGTTIAERARDAARALFPAGGGGSNGR